MAFKKYDKGKPNLSEYTSSFTLFTSSQLLIR